MECRDSSGVFNASVFNVWTCSLCYMYLFPNGIFKFNNNPAAPGLFKFTPPDINPLDIQVGNTLIEVNLKT